MFLKEIIELKKRRLATVKRETDFENLQSAAFAIRQTAERKRLHRGLQNDGINIIAEFKRASPSKGIINDNFKVAEIARAYLSGGACAISVLTEEDRFKGNLDDLRKMRQAVDLPILRKDFVFDEFQIYESAAVGADVVLLIAALLDDETLQNLLNLAQNELGMSVLVEVHTLEEFQRVRSFADLIGVNNRDLQSFRVSLDVSRELVKHKPASALMIAESGIRSRDEIEELKNLGFSGFLIGETLMRSHDPQDELKKLIGERNGELKTESP